MYIHLKYVSVVLAKLFSEKKMNREGTEHNQLHDQVNLLAVVWPWSYLRTLSTATTTFVNNGNKFPTSIAF